MDYKVTKEEAGLSDKRLLPKTILGERSVSVGDTGELD